MRTRGPRGIRTHIMFLAALAGLALVPLASAQVDGSLRIGDGAADLDVTGDGTAAETRIDADGNPVGRLDPTGAAAAIVGDTSTSRLGETSYIRLHTRLDDRLVAQLVASALEVPEVRDLVGGRARLDVALDKQHFQVDVADGKIQSVVAKGSVANADYIVRAGDDAARSLANAADPGFTAIKLLQNRYVTVEAAKFTHQAGLKAFFSGALDDRIDVRDGLEDVRFEGEMTAAEQAILASGLRIVRVEGRLFAANDLGALVAALHEGTRALGEPPAELEVRFSGVAGGATMDRTRLAALFADNAEAITIQTTMRAGGQGEAPGLDRDRSASLSARGAPDAFLMGLGAHQLAAAELREDSG